MATIALMILGIAITPLLKVKLLPDRSLPSISVYYSLPGANAIVVDSELTSKLEGIFSNVDGLQKLRSRTGAGNGTITLDIAKDADMDAVRFEVSTLVRQVYPDLPLGASYPQIRVSRPDEEERVEQLLSFTLNGPGNRWEIGQLAEELIKPTLAVIEGVNNVQLVVILPCNGSWFTISGN
jgi:multidrug efflux pump subunit AcrB